MKKLLLAFPLLLLSACNDAADIERVKSQVLAIDESITLGGAFDHRPACAKTIWTQYAGDKGRPTVEYRCDFALSAVQPEFQKLLKSWVQNATSALGSMKANLNGVLEEKQQAFDKLDKAKQLFDHLRASGDLQRYRDVVKGSPVETSSLNEVNNYFADISSDSYITQRFHGDGSVRTVVAQMYQAVTAAGFTPRGMYSNNCNDPAGLMLDVYPSLAEIEQHFTRCQREITQQYQFTIDDTNKRIATTEALLQKIDKEITLVSFQEVFKWSVIGNEDPTVYSHSFEFIVNNGTEQHYSLPQVAISKMDFIYAYSGEFGRSYQPILISMVSNLAK